MVQGGMSCVKYLLFAFNLVFVIFGILLIWSGSVVLGKIGDYEELIKDAPNNTAIALIIVGVIIFVIAFLGCCGALKESYVMLVTFGGIILIILLIELIGAGLTLGFKSNIKEVTKKGFKEAMDHYWDHPNSTLSDLMNDMQKNLKCCGANGPDDWKTAVNTTTHNPPPSCCEEPSVNQQDQCTVAKSFKTGCVDAFENLIKGSIGTLGGIAIAIALIQLFGIVFACSLARSIRKEYEIV